RDDEVRAATTDGELVVPANRVDIGDDQIAARQSRGQRATVVIQVGDGDVGRVQAVVIRVGASRGGRDDRVADIAVNHRVISAGDRDRLGDVPVAGRECQ